ncbi:MULTISPECIES: lipopolysaccharide assembly protein LapA domain-containing protein [unclassified Streptomyces]|uniref:lipopolysaccharide assembly protein LapA domain-containing protein n=1 Tax=unclassified Streptomyces TaxID=2593676 RepID=UPI001E360974|nr:lipopolysaccharide assembly protein LapA domain-containing protein [Streptomyces sp. CB02980]MCB8905989.1 lipopolysaccharide assembly protein LapA domain-containing protein [Streptomyces sp. CB02980]
MSPNETSRTSGGGASRFTEALTPGRIGMAVLAIVTLVFIFQNTREVKIRLLVPEVSMPLYLALLATALIGAACGYYVAARRRK